MINKQIVEELSAQLAKLRPKAEAAGDDAKKLLQAAATRTFERLDIVTREDFEAQRIALVRAQERIAQLEAALAKLEQHIEHTAQD